MSAKVSRKLVPNVLPVLLNFTFCTFFFWTLQNHDFKLPGQKHVSWVHVTFAQINYFPEESEEETSVRDHART